MLYIYIYICVSILQLPGHRGVLSGREQRAVQGFTLVEQTIVVIDCHTCV